MIKHIVKIKPEILALENTILKQQIGITELTNKNDGTDIKKYLQSVNLNEGLPYCYAGLYYCFLKATIDLNYKLSDIPLLKTGSTYYGYNHLVKQGTEQKPAIPEINDLIFWKYKDKIFGHVEQIIQIISPFEVITVGFNTSADKYFKSTESERDGGGVFKKYRKFKNLGNMFLRGLIGFKEI